MQNQAKNMTSHMNLVQTFFKFLPKSLQNTILGL